MIVRGILLAGSIAFVVATAIVFWPEDRPLNHYVPPEDRPLPVRADWLVVNVPTGVQPTDWYAPGYPPLVMLDRPFDTLRGDAALLVYPARSGMILDTRQVAGELRDEFGKVLTEMFGTMQHPTMPAGDTLSKHRKLEAQRDDLSVYIEKLQLDAETLEKGGKLFRIYCQHCHGLTGSGDALAGGRQLRPLPRDYRQGLFKFISTDPSVGGRRKPSRADLYRTIYNGLEEASIMPGFSAGLTPAQIQLVISYVIYLSIRGETEYEVMKKAADPEAEEMTRADVRQQLFDQAALIAPLWVVSARTPIVPGPNPYTTPDEVLDSATRGYALFNSSEVGCATCHVDYGRQGTFIFDSWGSITRSRDLTSAMCSGRRSDQPQQLYYRIYAGILGGNMPAYTQLRPTAEDRARGIDKIWDLVNFVRYLSENEAGLWPEVDLLYLRERQRLKAKKPNAAPP